MAETDYSYVIVDEFPYDVAEPERFQLEIVESVPPITSATLVGTWCDGDPQNPGLATLFYVRFDDPLSAGDETQLETLVAAHDGRVQTKDIATTDAALATTDKILLQSDDPTDEDIALSKDGSGNFLWRDKAVTTPRGLGDAVKLQGFSVHTSTPTADQYLKWNGVDSRWEATTGPTPHFGEWYDDEQDASEIGTTSGDWKDALTLTFPSDLALGDYIITCSVIARGSASATQIGVRQMFDSTELCAVTIQGTGSSSQIPMAGSHVQHAISGSHTYKIQYRKAGGAGTAYIKNRVIISWRVA